MKEQAMYKRYEGIKPIGVKTLCNVFGVAFFAPDEIDKYKEGCEIVAAYYGVSTGYTGFHKHMIFTTLSGRDFIRKGNMRIYLDEVVRV